MHFWIDKRSQVCSLSRSRYGGRRPVLSGLSNSNRHHLRGGASGPPPVGVACKMVTPVHRFQPIESAQSLGASRRAHHHHHHHHHRPRPHHPLASSSSSPHHSRFSGEPSLEIAAQDISESSELVGSGRGGGGMSLLPHGAASAGPGLAPQQQVLLRLPAPQREVLASGRLKCGLWATLALISFSVAAARFYSDNKGSGLEILYLMVCALLLLLLCCGCVISLCSATGPPRACFVPRSAQAPNNATQDSGPRSALIEVPEETSGGAEVHSSLSWTAPQSLSEQPLFEAQQSLLGGGEPPPYHIAIWLPQPEGEADDTQLPPPSYDNATS